MKANTSVLPVEDTRRILEDLPATPRMPVVFIGHGNPMNAIEDTPFARGWRQAARQLPVPTAIVCISAHWMTRGTWVTAMPQPRTIHDFYGFPPELFAVDYPAPGDPVLALEMAALLPAEPDLEWGLDHGAWSVLVHMYPRHDVPVLQVSLNADRSPQQEYEALRALRLLRDRGVLFLGSGNLVHNLRTASFRPDAQPFDWALEFDAHAAALVEAGDHAALIHYEKLGQAARLSIPTDEHYRPMLAALALSYPDERPAFFNEGIDLASVGMRSFVLGQETTGR